MPPIISYIFGFLVVLGIPAAPAIAQLLPDCDSIYYVDLVPDVVMMGPEQEFLMDWNQDLVDDLRVRVVDLYSYPGEEKSNTVQPLNGGRIGLNVWGYDSCAAVFSSPTMIGPNLKWYAPGLYSGNLGMQYHENFPNYDIERCRIENAMDFHVPTRFVWGTDTVRGWLRMDIIRPGHLVLKDYGFSCGNDLIITEAPAHHIWGPDIKVWQSGDLLHVQSEGLPRSDYRLELHAVDGKHIYSLPSVGSNTTTKRFFDVSMLARGIYVVRIHDAQRHFSKKVMIGGI